MQFCTWISCSVAKINLTDQTKSKELEQQPNTVGASEMTLSHFCFPFLFFPQMRSTSPTSRKQVLTV